ncbi:sensor histidine kinase [Nevskia ramosa]|uniref:sensor histidine kinase n=1 Tax=Nevskia ramosa TaxID=64002 RepID=UPI003D0B7FB7
MTLGALGRRLNPAPYRLRLLFRGAFLLLIIGAVAMALFLLQQEQQLSYRNYEDGLNKNAAQIAARLRHPAGQLALLNPPQPTAVSEADDSAAPTRLHPLLLPFSALDFDDQSKVQQAIEMAGCMVEYASDGEVCVAIGNNPWAGGFIYVAGSFAAADLVEHQRGDRTLSNAHRVRISVDLRGSHYQWLAPFEASGPVDASGRRGRLTGFADNGSGEFASRPIKDFRGWLWQASQCLEEPLASAPAPCSKRAFFSVRLPVDVLRDALFAGQGRPVWPPADLNRINVHVEVLPPGDGPALLDSASPQATPPFSLNDLAPLLLPGETLRIRKLTREGAADLLTLVGADNTPAPASRLLDRLLRRYLFDRDQAPIETMEVISTQAGRYELALRGDVRTVNKLISVVATRVSWFVVAMLLAILLAWLAMEIGIISRITVLTRRADSVSKTVKESNSLGRLDLSDLRGADELGVLAGCLSDLLQRVQEDVDREHIRAEQEKDMWHAVGHEIMSPLQSLMALHGEGDNGSRRYIERMQRAVRVLYGSASPSEAFQSTNLQLEILDLGSFLKQVADNASCIGIDSVVFDDADEKVLVRANEHSLEDVVTHILVNAERYRSRGTPIRIQLGINDGSAAIAITNQGPHIAEDLIDKIFEYGVSDPADRSNRNNRGQGLFVAKTYMAKMAGTVTALNVADGVSFVLSLPRAGS